MSPSVLFVCVKNGGKSQMAAALARARHPHVEVHSAGTRPGSTLNEASRRAVEEVGATFAGEHPKPIDPQVLARVDWVVVLGSEAQVPPASGMAGTVATWETDEPSARGIGGMERMRLVRDDIAARVQGLLAELILSSQEQPTPGPVIRVFEPALCCNTGVCGPELDENLVAFTADLDFLRGLGVDITRHNLANDPGAFAASRAVSEFLKVAGSAGLPLVLVDEVTVATGRYPIRAELARYAGRELPGAQDSGRADLGLSPAGACCGDGAASTSGSGCC